MKRDPSKLTKADTVALWHAVQWMALCLKQNEQFPSDTLATERERLAAARRALRKVNDLRRSGA